MFGGIFRRFIGIHGIFMFVYYKKKTDKKDLLLYTFILILHVFWFPISLRLWTDSDETQYLGWILKAPGVNLGD